MTSTPRVMRSTIEGGKIATTKRIKEIPGKGSEMAMTTSSQDVKRVTGQESDGGNAMLAAGALC